MTLLAVAGSLLLGFIVGFAVFKRSLLWCKACGSTLTCMVCTSPTRQGMRARS
jgi:hypothetical protein